MNDSRSPRGFTPTEAQMLEAWTAYADPHGEDVAETVAQFDRFLDVARSGGDTSRQDPDKA